MSNIFKNYFTSIGQELASKLPPTPPFIPPETHEIPAFTFPSVTSEFVQKQLQNMPETIWTDCMAGFSELLLPSFQNLWLIFVTSLYSLVNLLVREAC